MKAGVILLIFDLGSDHDMLTRSTVHTYTSTKKSPLLITLSFVVSMFTLAYFKAYSLTIGIIRYSPQQG